MSLTKRFYSGVFLKALATSNVKGSDNIKVVFSKLRSNVDEHTFNQLAPFVRKYWDTERHFVDSGMKLLKASITGNIKDPALASAVLIKTPTDQLVSVDNTLFSSCPKCTGRTYPGFTFCPHCGYSLTMEPRAPEPMLPLSQQPMPDYNSQGNMTMGGPTQGYMGSPTPTSVMPRGPATGPLGRGVGGGRFRASASNQTKEKMKAEVIFDKDGHKITQGDVDREMRTIHRHIPYKK